MTDESRGWLIAFKGAVSALLDYLPALDADERRQVAGILAEAQERINGNWNADHLPGVCRLPEMP